LGIEGASGLWSGLLRVVDALKSGLSRVVDALKSGLSRVVALKLRADALNLVPYEGVVGVGGRSALRFFARWAGKNMPEPGTVVAK
jgi:hypothetical protein